RQKVPVILRHQREVVSVYLDEADANFYLVTTHIALDYRLIGFGEYFTRLACLRDMLAPRTNLHSLVAAYLAATNKDFPRGWPDVEERTLLSSVPETQVGSEEEASGGTMRPSEGFQILHFVTEPGVLGERWVFRPGDSDFFPSVPHGHLGTKTPIKLDA